MSTQQSTACSSEDSASHTDPIDDSGDNTEDTTEQDSTNQTDDSETVTDPDPDQDQELEDTAKGFIVIHLDPSINPSDSTTSTAHQAAHWDSLVDIVDLADSYDFLLTLEFSPQWASYILQDSDRLSLVRLWEADGHQVAAHHHGTTHNTWDGYSNLPVYASHIKYLGGMDDFKTSIDQIPVSGAVSTGGIGGVVNFDLEYPQNMPYQTIGQTVGEVEARVSTIEDNEYDGQAVKTLEHMSYDASLDVTLDDIKNAINGAKELEYFGVGFHAYNYKQDPETYEDLFLALSETEISIITVEGIMDLESL